MDYSHFMVWQVPTLPNMSYVWGMPTQFSITVEYDSGSWVHNMPLKHFIRWDNTSSALSTIRCYIILLRWEHLIVKERI